MGLERTVWLRSVKTAHEAVHPVVVLCTVFAVAISSHLSALGQASFTLERAKAFAQASDWKGLLAYSQAWAKAEPTNPDAWYGIARANGSKLYRIGLQRPDEALPAYQRAVSLRPQWPEAWNALGMVAQELDRTDVALEALKKAVAQAPTRMNYWMSLAGSYSHARQPERAAEALDRAEKLAKTASEWEILGDKYYAFGDAAFNAQAFTKSQKAYQRALQLSPREGGVWTKLGMTKEALGSIRAAIADYEKGSQLGDRDGAKHRQRVSDDLGACQIMRDDMTRRGRATDMEFKSYKQKCTKFEREQLIPGLILKN